MTSLNWGGKGLVWKSCVAFVIFNNAFAAKPKDDDTTRTFANGISREMSIRSVDRLESGDGRDRGQANA